MKFAQPYNSMNDLFLDIERVKLHYNSYGFDLTFEIYLETTTIIYEARKRYKLSQPNC